MPFTLFHLGPALLWKGAFPRRASLTAFAATQVLIDFETLYHLLRTEWPVHRVLHSLVGASLVGLAGGFATWLLGRTVIQWTPIAHRVARAHSPALTAEISCPGAVASGVAGGLTHAVLDALFHDDVRPFWPLTSSAGWSDLVGSRAIHWACLLAGILGAAMLWIASRRSPPAA